MDVFVPMSSSSALILSGSQSFQVFAVTGGSAFVGGSPPGGLPCFVVQRKREEELPIISQLTWGTGGVYLWWTDPCMHECLIQVNFDFKLFGTRCFMQLWGEIIVSGNCFKDRGRFFIDGLFIVSALTIQGGVRSCLLYCLAWQVAL